MRQPIQSDVDRNSWNNVKFHHHHTLQIAGFYLWSMIVFGFLPITVNCLYWIYKLNGISKVCFYAFQNISVSTFLICHLNAYFILILYWLNGYHYFTFVFNFINDLALFNFSVVKQPERWQLILLSQL